MTTWRALWNKKLPALCWPTHGRTKHVPSQPRKSLSSSLCEKCQRPFKGVKPSNDSGNDRSVSYKHHQSWRELKTTAQAGCYICAWYIKQCPVPPETGDIDLDIWLRIAYQGLSIAVRDSLREDDYWLFMTVRPTSAMSQYVGDWIPPPHLTALHLRSLVTRWVTYCKLHHRKCIAPSRSYMPTRLLRISLDGPLTYVRLVEGENLPLAPYCTVSHCWGGEMLPKLLISNLLELQQGVDVATLPERYQEAILVSRSLVIDYIWIDSLCIMQDSVHDWRHEAGKIAQVYQGAELNIALTAASDGRESCLTGRNTLLLRPASVRASWVGEPETELLILPPEGWWLEELSQCKLLHRSWVLQEIQLAARVIILGREQIWQTCLEDIFCETFSGGSASSKLIALRAYNNVDLSFAKRNVYCRKEWERMVEVYSGCGLTVESDKAIAIGGMAQRYAQEFGDAYYAGMWLSQLPVQLLWQPIDIEFGVLLNKRPATYRAPTWSWLSMEGRVKFRLRGEDYPGTTLSDIRTIGVELEDPDNPWGGITDGFVVLNGHLTFATMWRRDRVSFIDHGAGIVTTIDGSDMYSDLRILCDADEPFLQWEEQTTRRFPAHLEIEDLEKHRAGTYPQLYMLPIQLFAVCYGLLLWHVHEKDSFKRVGVFSVSEKVAEIYLTNTERREVRII